MPQKINPDVLELIRGKTARVVGNLQTLLVLVKGLPLAYNRDLQEDKPPLFDSFDTVRASLELAAPLVAATELNREAIAERLDRGYLDATTLMEYLIRRGVPQRTAHGLVGRLVAQGAGSRRAAGRPAAGGVPRGACRVGREGLRRAGRPTTPSRRWSATARPDPNRSDEQIARWKERLAGETADDRDRS